METEYLILLCIAVNMAALYVIVGAKKTEINVTQKKKENPKKVANQRGPKVSHQKREALLKAIDDCIIKHGLTQEELMKSAGLARSSPSKWRNTTGSPTVCSYTKLMKTIKEINDNAAPK